MKPFLLVCSLLLTGAPLAAQERWTLRKTVEECTKWINSQSGPAPSFAEYEAAGSVFYMGHIQLRYQFEKCLARNGWVLRTVTEERVGSTAIVKVEARPR